MQIINVHFQVMILTDRSSELATDRYVTCTLQRDIQCILYMELQTTLKILAVSILLKAKLLFGRGLVGCH